VDIDETKAYAAEYVVNALCGGERFQAFHGLGSVGRYLVQMTAQGADANAKFISEKTSRTPEKYQAMEKEVVQDFVTSIVGVGEVKRTAVEAAAHLVEQVWDAYIKWAKEAEANKFNPEQFAEGARMLAERE
jgi:hypothetical protein